MKDEGCNIEKRRKRIGLFLVLIDAFFQTQLWKAIHDYCAERDWDLLIFCGGSINSPGPDEGNNNPIYRLMRLNKLDGLIVATGTMFNYTEVGYMEQYLSQFRGFPCVSLSIPVEGIPSILINNKECIKKVVYHLVRDHHYKHFCYISGPKYNKEAGLRLEGFLEALHENGLSCDPRCIYTGTHNEDSGIEAIEYFYDKMKLRPEVIVAGNDDMAMGAYKALKKRGYMVPEDVAITGFDGSESVNNYMLPITTILQPFYEMGFEAVSRLDKMMNGQEVPLSDSLSGSLVIKESCGCFGPFQSIPEDIDNSENLNKFLSSIGAECVSIENYVAYVKEHLSFYTKLLLDVLEINSNKKYFEDALSKLIIAFCDDISTLNKDSQVLYMLNSIIKNDVMAYETGAKWQESIYAVRSILDKVPFEKEVHSYIEDILFKANILAGQLLVRKQKAISFDTQLRQDMIREMKRSIAVTTRNSDMIRLVKQQLVNSKIKEFYICLYEEPITYINFDNFRMPEKALFRYGYNNGVDYEPQMFDTSELLPENVMVRANRADLVFHTLHFRNHQFGYIAVDLFCATTTVYATIRDQIANFLERKMLFDQLQLTNQQLQKISRIDPLTGVLNRRGFYDLGEALYLDALNRGLIVNVIYSDLDGLKMVNDMYGHCEGDIFIKTCANILETCCPKDAVIGRIGGDEFVVLFCDEPGQMVAQRTIKSIREEIIKRSSNFKYNFSLSLGVSQYDPELPLSLDDLIKQADVELYHDKRKRKIAK